MNSRVRWSSARITTVPMMMRSCGFNSTFKAILASFATFCLPCES